MLGLNKAACAILKAKKIGIFCHVNPDGDCIGSLLALGLALQKIGKKVFMVSPDGLPNKYKSLPGARDIKRKLSLKVDLAISVDCNNKEMLGSSLSQIIDAKAILEIDHHAFRRPFGDIALIDTEAGAVGEIIFLLLKKLKIHISKEIAYNILVSIVVETGSFRFPSYRPLTFRICAELTEREEIDLPSLSELIYWSKTKEELLLSGICLSRCKFKKGARIIWSIAKKEDFKRLKGKDEDIDTVADEMRAVKNVLIAVLFREKGAKVRVSLRSKGMINVARLAQEFGGGGHSDVAGCVVPNTPEMKKNILKQASRLLAFYALDKGRAK